MSRPTSPPGSPLGPRLTLGLAALAVWVLWPGHGIALGLHGDEAWAAAAPGAPLV